MVAAVAVAVVAPAAPVRAADAAAAPPPFTYGFGLTEARPAVGTATDFHLTVTTPQVAGEQHIKIILPSGYYDDPDRRYPVLYFLHGSPDDPVGQNYTTTRTGAIRCCTSCTARPTTRSGRTTRR